MHFRKKAGVLACFACLLLPTIGAQEAKLTWFSSYEEGRAAAQRQDRLMIVSVETDWCAWCRVMEQQVFADPEVVRRYAAAGYVWVRLDAQTPVEGVAASIKFKAFSYPYTAVVDPSDELFVSFTGYRDVQAFVGEVDKASAKLQSLAEVKVKIRRGTASEVERLRLAREYQKHGLYLQASQVFETLLHEPAVAQREEILFALAICQASGGQPENALSNLAEFAKEFPQSPLKPDAEALRWEIKLRSPRPGDAATHLRAWLAGNPDHRLTQHVRSLLAQQD